MVQDFVAPPLRSLKSLLHSLYGFCALKLVRSTCGKSNLNAAKIVNCVYNFLLHYSGTLIKNSILSSVKISCQIGNKNSSSHPTQRPCEFFSYKMGLEGLHDSYFTSLYTALYIHVCISVFRPMLPLAFL